MPIAAFGFNMKNINSSEIHHAHCYAWGSSTAIALNWRVLTQNWVVTPPPPCSVGCYMPSISLG